MHTPLFRSLAFKNRSFWSVFAIRMLSPMSLPVGCRDLTSVIYDSSKQLSPAYFNQNVDQINYDKIVRYALDVSKTLLVDFLDGESLSYYEYFEINESLIEFFVKIHIANANVWDNEDPCRQYTGTGDLSHIPKCKQGIDIANQRRNDLVEKCDDAFCASIATYGLPIDRNARLASEGLGSLLDRMSINSLKLYHTILLTHEKQGDMRDKLIGKIGAIINQNMMLATQCDNMIYDMLHGNLTYIKFKQYKLYNSADTNSHYQR